MPVRIHGEHFNICPTWHHSVIPDHWRLFSMLHCSTSTLILKVEFPTPLLHTPCGLFAKNKHNRLVQQHISVGVWCPWIKQLPVQHGCKDVHCLRLRKLQGEPSFLSLPYVRVILFLQAHLIINKKTSVHHDKKKWSILLLFMLIFKQKLWLTITQKNTPKKDL